LSRLCISASGFSLMMGSINLRVANLIISPSKRA
jgi:hypothetical protein